MPDNLLSDWAKHFRQQYCSDQDLPLRLQGTGKTATEYLRDIVFPDAKLAPGPSVRAGDFAEILLADYLQYILQYWCPRVLRYQDRWNRNDPTKGCDVVGFKLSDTSAAHDELFIIESKSGFSKTNKNRLQVAIDDSKKDHLREAMTLNAMKQRLLMQGDGASAKRVERFQDEADRPFRRINGAAAVLDDEVFAETNLLDANCSGHPNQSQLRLLVIRGPSLMKLVHALYERAANEA